MINYKIRLDSGERILETNLSGEQLLHLPQLNKGSAFTAQERRDFGLLGRLPCRVESLDEQVDRAYAQFSRLATPEEKAVFISELYNINQVLVYKMISEHVMEMTPIVYTPHVATTVSTFSNEFRKPRGLYISYEDRDSIEEILENRATETDMIVVTDGERILGIGDQGVGGIGIPIGKLMLYSLFGGIDPMKTLPIVLDVGTNNQEHLDDPRYLGWRHPRISREEYDKFIAKFVAALNKKLPGVFLQWEDFSKNNAPRILREYRDKICSFNDDIQGTAAVTLAALLAAFKANGTKLTGQRFVILGAGSASTGIADLIVSGMVRAGMSEQDARRCFWILNSKGLITEKSENMIPSQTPYLRDSNELANWELTDANKVTLLDVVKNVKPTVLIGCSTVPGSFTEEIIKEMASHVDKPIIFPLSNPTSKCEALPVDIINWTDGKALVATGSPFDPVIYKGNTYSIAQCNNALTFPGIGLGTVASKATRISDEMIWVACESLHNKVASSNDSTKPLLPSISEGADAAKEIGYAVAEQARKEGLATVPDDVDIRTLVDERIWKPQYCSYKKL